ncbi:unnamed protein product, partial [marine sediment metagenome]
IRSGGGGGTYSEFKQEASGTTNGIFGGNNIKDMYLVEEILQTLHG